MLTIMIRSRSCLIKAELTANEATSVRDRCSFITRHEAGSEERKSEIQVMQVSFYVSGYF